MFAKYIRRHKLDEQQLNRKDVEKRRSNIVKVPITYGTKIEGKYNSASGELRYNTAPREALSGSTALRELRVTYKDNKNMHASKSNGGNVSASEVLSLTTNRNNLSNQTESESKGNVSNFDAAKLCRNKTMDEGKHVKKGTNSTGNAESKDCSIFTDLKAPKMVESLFVDEPDNVTKSNEENKLKVRRKIALQDNNSNTTAEVFNLTNNRHNLGNSKKPESKLNSSSVEAAKLCRNITMEGDNQAKDGGNGSASLESRDCNIFTDLKAPKMVESLFGDKSDNGTETKEQNNSEEDKSGENSSKEGNTVESKSKPAKVPDAIDPERAEEMLKGINAYKTSVINATQLNWMPLAVNENMKTLPAKVRKLTSNADTKTVFNKDKGIQALYENYAGMNAMTLPNNSAESLPGSNDSIKASMNDTNAALSKNETNAKVMPGHDIGNKTFLSNKTNSGNVSNSLLLIKAVFEQLAQKEGEPTNSDKQENSDASLKRLLSTLGRNSTTSGPQSSSLNLFNGSNDANEGKEAVKSKNSFKLEPKKEVSGKKKEVIQYNH